MIQPFKLSDFTIGFITYLLIECVFREIRKVRQHFIDCLAGLGGFKALY